MVQTRALKSSKRSVVPRKPVHSASGPHDYFHNRDSPCCRLLHELASELCSNKSTFAQLLWFLLRKQRQEEIALETVSSPVTPQTELEAIAAARKKKRKKKKKKSVELGSTASAEEAVEDGPDDGTEDPVVEPTAMEEVVAPSTPVRNTYPDALAAPLRNGSRRIRHDHFDAFLDHLLGTLEGEELSGLLTHLDELTTQLPSIVISDAELLQARNDIVCERCRSEIVRFLNNHAKVALEKKPQVSFDYVAMEEGMLPSGDTGYGVCFERVEPDEGDSHWMLITPYKDSQDILQTVRDLAHDYVLARGFSQEERLLKMGYRVEDLSRECITAIGDRVDGKCAEWNNTRNNLTKKLEQFTSGWVEAVKGNGDGMETTTFPKLCSIEEGLAKWQRDVQRDLIRPLVDAYCATAMMFLVNDSAGNNGEIELKVKRCIEDLWKAYIENIDTCMEQVAVYEAQLFQLESRNNVIPAAYTSPTIRQLHCTLVHKKLLAAQKLVDEVDKIVWSDVDAGVLDIASHSETSLLRMLLTRQEFCEVVDGQRKVGLPAKLEKMDSDWEVFIQDLTRCADTVYQPSSEKIVQAHDRTRRQLKISLLNAVKSLEDAGSGSLNDLSFQDCSGADDDAPPGSYLCLFTESLSHEQHSLDSFRSNFKRCACMTLKVWTDLRPFYQPMPKVHDSALPLQMPFELIKRMSKNGDDALSTCHPGKEEDRAACILAGLYFRKLSVLCDEWRANVAGLELLTIMAIDLHEDQQQADTKAKKKPKKKNKKAADPVVGTPLSEKKASESKCITITEDVHASSVLDSSVAVAEELSLPDNGEARQLRPKPIDATDVHVDDKNVAVYQIASECNSEDGMKSEIESAEASQGDVPVQSSGSNELSSGDANTGKSKSKRLRKGKNKNGNGSVKDSSLPFEMSADSGERYRSLAEVDRVIGVYDDHGVFETAQDFLMARLMLAMREIEENQV